MNLDVLKTNARLMRDVRSHLGLDDENDTSKDDTIAKMTKHEIFNHYLNWNGIIGYSEKIYKTYTTLNKSVLDDSLSHEELAQTDTGNEIIECLRKSLGFPDFDSDEFDDKKFDSAINNLSSHDAFCKFLEWNGIIGYGGSLSSIIRTIEEASA